MVEKGALSMKKKAEEFHKQNRRLTVVLLVNVLILFGIGVVLDPTITTDAVFDIINPNQGVEVHGLTRNTVDVGEVELKAALYQYSESLVPSDVKLTVEGSEIIVDVEGNEASSSLVMDKGVYILNWKFDYHGFRTGKREIVVVHDWNKKLNGRSLRSETISELVDEKKLVNSLVEKAEFEQEFDINEIKSAVGQVDFAVNEIVGIEELRSPEKEDNFQFTIAVIILISLAAINVFLIWWVTNVLNYSEIIAERH